MAASDVIYCGCGRNAPTLLEDYNWLRSNTLRMGLALSAIIYFTFILCHRDPVSVRCPHRRINEMATVVAVDILDGIAILDVLFHSHSRDKVSLFTTIIIITIISV